MRIKDHIGVIAIDLDDTLALGELDSIPMIERKLNVDILILMKHYRDLGYAVIIYTGRDISRKGETLIWLNSHNIRLGTHYSDIVFNKLKYDFIIDNRSIHPVCISSNHLYIDERGCHVPHKICQDPDFVPEER